MYDENGKLFPWYELRKPKWTEQFKEEFRKRWDEHAQTLESLIWNTNPNSHKLKQQQYMTPITSENEELIRAVSNALYGSVNPYSYEYAKTTIKLIENEGFCFCRNQDAQKQPSSDLCAQLAPGQSTGDTYAKTGKEYSSETYTIPVCSFKPFMLIDINAVKGKDFTQEEIIRILEQTGSVNIIRKKKNLTWGQAMEWLKEGKKVARTGWNGNGMFVYYVPPASYPSVTEVAKKEFGSVTFYEGYLAIKNMKDTVNTWVPSVSDNFAEDWYVVE